MVNLNLEGCTRSLQWQLGVLGTTSTCGWRHRKTKGNCVEMAFNPLNPELNPICYLLALLGAHHFLHVSRIRVKSLTLRLLMSYIWSTHS